MRYRTRIAVSGIALLLAPHQFIELAGHYRSHLFRSLMLTPVLCLVLFGSRCEAMTISDYGGYTIVAGVHQDDAEIVHAAVALLGGLTPVHIDAFADLNTVYYSSIWKPADGVKREIFLKLETYEVRNRLQSNQDLNELLQVDAWTRNEGSLEYSSDYYPAFYFETYCCGIWTGENLPERRFVYHPLGHDENNLYWDPNAQTIHEKQAELLDEGFELLSASKVRPDWPKPQKKPGFWDIDQAEAIYYYDSSAIVALYEKNAAPSSGLFQMSLDEAKDFVADENADGYQPAQVEPYQGHPWGPFWAQATEAWTTKFGVVTRKDDRVHQIAWGFEEMDIDWAHHLMYSGSMKPVSITASRWPGVLSYEWRYTLIFREKDIRVKDGHDPASDLKPASRNDGNDPSKW